MHEVVISSTSSQFQWVDVVTPTHEELDKLADEFNLHHTSIQDCLDPEHLPKFEKIENVNFLILRVFDERSTSEADTAQELTRKIALFFGHGFILTIHRNELPFLESIKKSWKEKPIAEYEEDIIPIILANVLRVAVLSYEKPVDAILNRVDELELKVFMNEHGTKILEECYYLKRKSSVYKRLIKMTGDIFSKITVFHHEHNPLLQDAREKIEDLHFYLDDVLENLNNLLNLYLSMQSHKINEASLQTNEVMRFLTIFSAFFMPLTFIVGVYGMNFKFMPELNWHYGYIVVWAIMLGLSLAIFLWFKKKKWLT